MKCSKYVPIFIVLFSLAAILDDHNIIIYFDFLSPTTDNFWRSDIIISIYDLVTDHDWSWSAFNDHQIMITLLTDLFSCHWWDHFSIHKQQQHYKNFTNGNWCFYAKIWTDYMTHYYWFVFCVLSSDRLDSDWIFILPCLFPGNLFNARLWSML